MNYEIIGEDWLNTEADKLRVRYMGVDWKERMRCYGWYFNSKYQVIPEGYRRQSVDEFYEEIG